MTKFSLPRTRLVNSFSTRQVIHWRIHVEAYSTMIKKEDLTAAVFMTLVKANCLIRDTSQVADIRRVAYRFALDLQIVLPDLDLILVDPYFNLQHDQYFVRTTALRLAGIKLPISSARWLLTRIDLECRAWSFASLSKPHILLVLGIILSELKVASPTRIISHFATTIVLMMPVRVHRCCRRSKSRSWSLRMIQPNHWMHLSRRSARCLLVLIWPRRQLKLRMMFQTLKKLALSHLWHTLTRMKLWINLKRTMKST